MYGRALFVLQNITFNAFTTTAVHNLILLDDVTRRWARIDARNEVRIDWTYGVCND